jgi:hypothetical protein
LWASRVWLPPPLAVVFVRSGLQRAGEAGVDRVANCPAIWDADANDHPVAAAKQHPERFATLGWFPLDDAADESLVGAWLDKPGMLGLRFMLAAPEMADRLASGGLDWLWVAAGRRGTPSGSW